MLQSETHEMRGREGGWLSSEHTVHVHPLRGNKEKREEGGGQTVTVQRERDGDG